MKRLISTSLLVAGLMFGLAKIAGAQTYDLSWHTIAGGGGTSTGTNASSVVYSISGTIGQSDAGSMTSSNGTYSLTGGFWGILGVVQTPGAPLLSIKVVDATHVSLLWPVTSSTFAPQQNPALGTTNWSRINTNTFPITVSGGTNSMTLPVSGNLYFRLISP